jgi:hypothetical protein
VIRADLAVLLCMVRKIEAPDHLPAWLEQA